MKSGILKIEQREGVPTYISFTTRLVNSYIILLVFQIPLIIIWNITAASSDFGTNFKYGGLLNLINYQPIISIFIMAVTLFFVLMFNGYINVLFMFIVSLIYSLSPLISLFSLDSKGYLSENTKSLLNIVPNIELGKSFYDYSLKNNLVDDMYEDNYISNLDNVSKLEGSYSNIERIEDLYSSNAISSFQKLFHYGDIYSIENDSEKDSFSRFESLLIFKNYLDPIFKASSNIKINNNSYKDFFVRDNSIFLQNFNIDLYDNYLNDLLSENTINSNKNIYNLVLFMKNNFENLLDVYKNTSNTTFPPGDSVWCESNIILGYYDCYSNRESDDDKNIERNYMLDTLIWEIVTYYNLSISPTLVYSNDVEDYAEVKKYSSSYKNNFDTLMLTNHLYTICNFTDSLTGWKNLRYNSYFSNLVDGKLIAKPFSVDFFNDEELTNVLNGSDNINTKKPYSATISFKITKNINVTLLRIMYPLCSIILMCILYLLFRNKMIK